MAFSAPVYLWCLVWTLALSLTLSFVDSFLYLSHMQTRSSTVSVNTVDKPKANSASVYTFLANCGHYNYNIYTYVHMY